MKKIAICLVVICLSSTLIPIQSNAVTTAPPSSLVDPKSAESAEVKVLLLRLEEIKAKDFSKLKASEKKELRKEVKSINDRLKAPGGIYLSVGAIIIIILLLILLL
jgi:hypothetical protein